MRARSSASFDDTLISSGIPIVRLQKQISDRAPAAGCNRSRGFRELPNRGRLEAKPIGPEAKGERTMKPLLTVVSIMTLTASAWGANPISNQGPLPKNVAPLNYRVHISQVVVPEFTKKDAKKLAATAESA